MDSCAAAVADLRSPKHEHLFASAFESFTTTEVNDSVARRLIDLLQSNDGCDITVVQVHAKLMNNAREPNGLLNVSPVHVAPQEKPTSPCTRCS